MTRKRWVPREGKFYYDANKGEKQTIYVETDEDLTNAVNVFKDGTTKPFEDEWHVSESTIKKWINDGNWKEYIEPKKRKPRTKRVRWVNKGGFKTHDPKVRPTVKYVETDEDLTNAVVHYVDSTETKTFKEHWLSDEIKVKEWIEMGAWEKYVTPRKTRTKKAETKKECPLCNGAGVNGLAPCICQYGTIEQKDEPMKPTIKEEIEMFCNEQYGKAENATQIAIRLLVLEALERWEAHHHAPVNLVTSKKYVHRDHTSGDSGFGRGTDIKYIEIFYNGNEFVTAECVSVNGRRDPIAKHWSTLHTKELQAEQTKTWIDNGYWVEYDRF